uniref:SH3 domain-containing protein n=1 Tax=Heterorhabditis bacteriophora TaxID=37862 RepID=A0A1I7XVD4_HETBA
MSDEVSYVIVKYDYLAQEDQELTIKKNERLRLIDDSKNWWKVVNETNNIGFVPSNYVRKESLVDKARGTIKGFTKSRPRAPDFVPEDSSSVLGTVCDSRPVFSTTSNHQSKVGQISPDLAKPSVMNVRALVKFAYEPRLEDELRLTKGETIIVIDKSSDGWWKGEAGIRAQHCTLFQPILTASSPYVDSKINLN